MVIETWQEQPIIKDVGYSAILSLVTIRKVISGFFHKRVGSSGKIQELAAAITKTEIRGG